MRWIDADSLRRTSGGEFDHDAQAAAWARNGLVGDVVRHYRHRAEGRSAIVFASSIAHSRALAAEFAGVGITAEHVDGETAPEIRAAILRRLDSGATQVVCNFGVLIEGFDCTRVACIVLARATASLSLWLQSAGRGLRPHPGKGDCIVLDHGGNGRRHGNLDFARAWSRDGRDKRTREPTGVQGRECPTCALFLPLSIMVCPECGHDFAEPKPEREIKVADGELELLPAAAAPFTQPVQARPTPRQPWRRVLDERNERAAAWAAKWARG